MIDLVFGARMSIDVVGTYRCVGSVGCSIATGKGILSQAGGCGSIMDTSPGVRGDADVGDTRVSRNTRASDSVTKADSGEIMSVLLPTMIQGNSSSSSLVREI